MAMLSTRTIVSRATAEQAAIVFNLTLIHRCWKPSAADGHFRLVGQR